MEENTMRILQHINDSWLFVHRADCDPACIPEDGTPVTLPHSWNAVDGHDGHAIHIASEDWSQGDLSGKPMSKYDRGTYWYYRMFRTPSQPLPGGRVYIEVPAAALMATVYVNGQKAVYHEGGFSLFRADITALCNTDDDNLLAICVSNEYASNVYPQHADFTFYGGLYRGVNLISVPDAHFDLDFYGAPGVMATPKLLKNHEAVLDIRSFVKGCDENNTIFYTLEDEEGQEVASACADPSDTSVQLLLTSPLLWSPDAPHLYLLTASLLRRNEVIDEVSVHTGIRTFSVSPSDGFFLNGRSMPLRGVCRHQDRLYQGNALATEDHYEDALIIKELGANAIRLAHYQHAQAFYDACDELGFVVWAEIPFITIMSEDHRAHENCISQMKELIYQNYNHPCICFWGLSNEVLLAGQSSEQLIENHRDLERLVKSIDPTRLTTLAHVANTPEDSALHEITDVEAYNHYMGWYVGKMEDNGPWLDKYHQAHPERCLGVSEYGCEGIISFHSANPESRDYSEEYQALYHEELARVFASRPYIWGSFLWNMFDFGAAERNEGGVAGRNNKGLVTLDRKIKKDAYYIYKTYWNADPMVHICGKRYAKRAGDTTLVRIYSNLPEVALYVNGRLHSVMAGDKVFVFSVALKDGKNQIVARAGSCSDSTCLEKVTKEPEIYTLPFVRERNEKKAGWIRDAEGQDLQDLLGHPEGFYSIYDTIGCLASSDRTSAFLQEVLCVLMKAEKSQMDLNSKRFERFKDVTLEQMLKTHNDPRLNAGINRHLTLIPKP